MKQLNTDWNYTSNTQQGVEWLCKIISLKMNGCLKIIVFLSFLVYGMGNKGKTVFQIFSISKDLITSSFDLGSLLNTGNDDVNEKMEEVQKQLKEIMSYFEFTLAGIKNLLKEEIFFQGLNRDVQDIKSCLKEYDYFREYINDKGIRENFRNRCDIIITPLRKIRNILTGGKAIGSTSLGNHFKEKEGFCNGTTISEIILYISKFYVEGCSAFVLAQKHKHGNSSKTYLEECNNGLSDSSAYMKAFYESCSRIACSDNFQSKLDSVVNDLVIGKSANETVSKLKKIFPYLEFIVIQKNLSSLDTCSIPVNTQLKHKTFRGKEFQFDVFALPSSFRESNISSQNKQNKAIEVPSSTFIDIATSDIEMESIYDGMTIHAFVVYVNETPCIYEIHHVAASATDLPCSLPLITGLLCWQFYSYM